jgi:hypothetical protein
MGHSGLGLDGVIQTSEKEVPCTDFGWDLTAKWNRIEGFIGMNGVRIQNLDIKCRR